MYNAYCRCNLLFLNDIQVPDPKVARLSLRRKSPRQRIHLAKRPNFMAVIFMSSRGLLIQCGAFIRPSWLSLLPACQSRLPHKSFKTGGDCILGSWQKSLLALVLWFVDEIAPHHEQDYQTLQESFRSWKSSLCLFVSPTRKLSDVRDNDASAFPWSRHSAGSLIGTQLRNWIDTTCTLFV